VTIEAKMTAPKHPSQTSDVEAGFESESSGQTANFTVAADRAVTLERKAGHEHAAYPEGIARISNFTAVVVLFFFVFLDMAIMSTVMPAVTAQFNTLTSVGWSASAYQLTSAAFTPLTGNI
jgi:hypothetical protein